MEREEVKRAQLMMLFRGMRKGEETSTEDYVNQLKSISDSLAAIGSPVSDTDLVLQLLAGLTNPKYMLLQNRITSRCPLPNFSEACSMLRDYDQTTAAYERMGNDRAMNSLILHEGNNRSMNTPSYALQGIDPQVTTQNSLQPETIVKIVGAIAASPVVALIAKECWKKFESYLDNKLQGNDTDVPEAKTTMEMYHEVSSVSSSGGKFRGKRERSYWSGTSTDQGWQLDRN